MRKNTREDDLGNDGYMLAIGDRHLGRENRTYAEIDVLSYEY